ncbi:hypothetical protein EDD80_103204 [Anseongella ginsenosidimutans]|uniref:Uncharacterized protein n=1 Tax=Anseongella ginsenosidimutans TaxID=496056 RepID=A0A4R3KTQ5_9SPHI|nr:hypothetical protein [Anseongella ginsenosidimutans]QEC53449.1 hypothetical protein FRZ59_14625 [Anseongella ginsenosidimutans]TCS88340.1 hypothetical protein EDD80_103204 [Anseongella ginsenosidimutans]
MTTVHLTDKQLQEFAEVPDNLGPEEMLHISKCESCRLRVRNYTLLYAGLNAMEKPAFDFDLAPLVVGQLPPSRISAPKSKYYWAAVLCACIGTAFVALMVWVYSPQLAVLFRRLPGIGLYMVVIPTSVTFLLQCSAYIKEYKRNLIFGDRSHQLLK